MDEIEIIYQDADLVAVNKPHGLLVHPSSIAKNATQFAMQMVRDQIGKYVYPAHRLDRKTSGVLLFALHKSAAKTLGEDFTNGRVIKTYHAIVRGYFPSDDMVLDYDLTNDRGKTQSAVTAFNLLKKSEISVPFGKFDTSRYSLVSCNPKTGRMHQIRKHLAHLRHPIIADRPHGCNKQNKLFKDRWDIDTMLLHALCIELRHPVSKEKIVLNADYSGEFKRVLKLLSLTAVS